MNDLKFACRQLLKQPAFTATALLTLALCIGANLTIFAIVDAVLLRPLPFVEPDRLVTLFDSYPKNGIERSPSSFTQLYSRQGSIDSFSHVAGFKEDSGIVGRRESNERKDILRVSADFFSTLGVSPRLGRGFAEEEMTFQTHHLAILSDRYWREHFDSDPNVLGKEIRVNGFSKTIVGVLPESFRFLSSRAEIVLPLSSDPNQRGIGGLHDPNFQLIARLKPGATIPVAQSQIDAHNREQGREFPYAKQVAESGFFTKVAPLHHDHVAAIRPTLLLMQGGVLLLVLIGGVNLINLLLVRASSRSKEMAIRQSIGAGRGHVVRQVLTETVLLAVVGGLCGLVVGAGGIRLLAVLGVDQLPLGAQIAFDARVAAVALLGAVVIGFAVGAPIAWFNFLAHPARALQAETRGGTAGHSAQRLRHGFIVAQMALAFVLLTGAGLLAVSLKRVMEVSPGFRPGHVLTGHISLLHRNYLERNAQLSFARRLMEELANQPGLSAFGLITEIPVDRSGGKSKRAVTVAGQITPVDPRPHLPVIYGVLGNYFDAMGIPLRDGRGFDPSELRDEKFVCVVDDVFARRYWAEGNAVGQKLLDRPRVEDGQRAFTIIGVVGAIKQTDLTEKASEGAIYFPASGDLTDLSRIFVVARTVQSPEQFAPALQKLVRRIEPELPVHDVRSMETRITDSLVARRSPALLAVIFAGVALFLATIGTYGVLAFAVAQRRREIGVRMALGALPRQIGRQFLMLGLRLLFLGALFGAIGSWWAGRAMQSVLFNVPAFHPLSLIATALVLGAATLFACLAPSLRASRVDPMEALRAE